MRVKTSEDFRIAYKRLKKRHKSLQQDFERSSNVKYDTNMEEKKFKNYSDQEFKEALRATLNLKKEWMASVAQREKELGIQ